MRCHCKVWTAEPLINFSISVVFFILKETKDHDGTAASAGMVGRGGDAAGVKALLSVDATDCWHLLSWWWSGFLGALPPSLWSLLLSIQSSPPYVFFVQLYASCQLYLLSFLTVQVLWINPELEPFCWPCVYSVGPRITVPRSLRWASCGAVSVSASTALLVRLFSPECEPQNIAAYDKPELKPE